MMKKLTKAALLAAATVFMLAACSHSSGGGGEKEENPPKEPNVSGENSGRTTTGKWDFANQADTVDWVAKFKTNTITKESDGTCSLDKSGDIMIESEALSASTDGLTLTILAEKPWSGATNPNYSLQAPESGLRIKNPALKIADVKGTVKVTIEWACIKGKVAGDRKLQLLKDSGTVVKEADNDNTSNATANTAMTSFEETVVCGEGTNLYIGKVTLTEITTEVKVTDIKVSAPAGSENNKVTVNKTLQLTATVAPEDATSKSVEWKSSNDTIATVSANGLVTGVAAGEVTITATATDGSGIKDEITLTVVADSEPTPPESDPDDKEEDLSSIFTIEDGVLNLVADEYAYALSEDNLKDTTGNNAWSSASDEALKNMAEKTGKTYFTTKTNVVNMSKPTRSITLKVKNVAAIDVHVFDSNGNRDYTVQVGSNDAVTYQSVKTGEGNVIKTNTTDAVEIVIAGVSQSVYPVGVILYKEVPQDSE